MYATVNKDNELEIHTLEDDMCFDCNNTLVCPLVRALYQEEVILHYSNIRIDDCGLYN